MAPNQYLGISEYGKVIVHRSEDAQALFRERRWRAAMYLAGYVVECQLKRKLMLIFQCSDLLELESELRQQKRLNSGETLLIHSLQPLLRMTGGLDRLRANAERWSDFNLVNRWVPGWRYSPRLGDQDEASTFLQAVERVRHWLEHNL